MPFSSPVVEVTSTASIVVPNAIGRSLGDPIPTAITNTGSAVAYFGGPEVIASATVVGAGGFPIPPGGILNIDEVFTDVLWAVCAAGQSTTLCLLLGRQ
jgi:hypothetical protein